MRHLVLHPDPASTTVAPDAELPARIELRAVSKRYRVGDVTVTAVEHADLSVAASSFVVLLGPSGSGKTTLLNLIGALDTRRRPGSRCSRSVCSSSVWRPC